MSIYADRDLRGRVAERVGWTGFAACGGGVMPSWAAYRPWPAVSTRTVVMPGSKQSAGGMSSSPLTDAFGRGKVRDEGGSTPRCLRSAGQLPQDVPWLSLSTRPPRNRIRHAVLSL